MKEQAEKQELPAVTMVDNGERNYDWRIIFRCCIE